jgi:hypothetical protein
MLYLLTLCTPFLSSNLETTTRENVIVYVFEPGSLPNCSADCMSNVWLSLTCFVRRVVLHISLSDLLRFSELSMYIIKNSTT